MEGRYIDIALRALSDNHLTLLRMANEKLIDEPAVPKSLKKLEGELTEVDVGKVKDLSLEFITDVGLKEVVKLQNLTYLSLYGTPITDADVKAAAKL